MYMLNDLLVKVSGLVVLCETIQLISPSDMVHVIKIHEPTLPC